MHPTETVLALFAAVAALAYLAARVKVPYPIFLVLGGLALTSIPGLPAITLDPDLVFILFLPPILYFAGLMTSWRDFKANKRPIFLLSFGLVLFTTLLVGVAAHHLIGMPWPVAFVLGAIVSPPDAVAATAIMSRMRLPRRIITLLEGESLVNDATALVAYRIAVAAVVGGGAFSLPQGAIQFLTVAAGGIAVGLVIGVIVAWLRPHVRDDGIEGMVSLLTPYAAYLPAEHLHVSGVLAAVTTGIYMARRMPQITAGHTRLKLYAVWDTQIFILNGLVFILIGLQLPTVLERLRDADTPHLWRDAAVISAIVIALRMLWVYPATYLPRWLVPAIARRDPAPPHAHVFLVAWTGLRGIVSLAAALALPMATAAKSPFPYRDYIIFLTFAVIVVTLVLQGLSLPLFIRRLNLADDDTGAREELRARYESTYAAISRLDALVLLDEATPDAIKVVRAELDREARYLSAQLNNDDVGGQATLTCATQQAARREALSARQQMILKLRDDGTIADEVLRRLQAELDHEETRLAET